MADVIAELRGIVDAFGVMTCSPMIYDKGREGDDNDWVLHSEKTQLVAYDLDRRDAVQLAMSINALPALLDMAEASQKLSAALTACDPYFQTSAVLMQRFGPYTGPTFGAEHEALRAALARLEPKHD